MNAYALDVCRLCPRQCGVDRVAGDVGFCGAGAVPRLYRCGPHDGEEPPISGGHGSGTLFLSHCPMSCLYCQNHPWTHENEGRDLTVAEVGRTMAALRDEAHVHNWNFVTPTPWLPLLREAVAVACESGTRLPIVYNTSGYERVEVLDAFQDLADIYLGDLRYSEEASACEGSRAPGYVEAARSALRYMWGLRGPLTLDENGIALSGVICRLLILPGKASEVVDNLEWVADTLGPEVPISVMAQYLPLYRASRTPSWDRGITREEYDLVVDAVDRLGFETGWIQELECESPAHLLGRDMPAGSWDGAW
jgi:putative pyruvate formate lyase activating enzyme